MAETIGGVVGLPWPAAKQQSPLLAQLGQFDRVHEHNALAHEQLQHVEPFAIGPYSTSEGVYGLCRHTKEV